jgi:fibronectin type 3 domain-containing protein
VPGLGQVALSWTANPPEENVTRYRIHRGVLPGGPYTYLAEVSVFAYTDMAAINGSTYYYVLRAVNSAGLASGYSLEVFAKPTGPDTTPPAPPFIATADRRTRTATPTLSGTAEPSAIVEVRLGSQTVGTGAAGTDGKWSVTTSALPEGPQSLAARARDAAGNLSGLSNSVMITVDLTPPGLVTGLRALRGPGYIDLFWDPNPAEDLLGYVVYRATTLEGPYTRVNDQPVNGTPPDFPAGGVVVGTQFRDRYTVDNGVTYYYKVIAVDNAEN